MQRIISRGLFALLALFLLAGCAAPAPTPAPPATAVAELPTQTPYPTATVYPTFTPFPTPVPPTSTPTAVPTLAPTATLTPTVQIKPAALPVTPKPAAPPATVQPAQPQPAGSAELWRTPGLYLFTPLCGTYNSSFYGHDWNETFCISQVEVYPQVLRFYGHWQLHLLTGTFQPRQAYHPRSTSFAFYVVDNLGNKYIHGRTGGAADADTVVQAPDYLLGFKDNDNAAFAHEPNSWWEFEPAKPGASSFTFVDDVHGLRLGPIVLSR